ncbi:MAG TPA: SIMPL domain-containing protein [Candidatus Dormibacteraeota bacterium]|nr:SIMPL domain-containing protein [Candidatus Dormibacteraeota bacterium]
MRIETTADTVDVSSARRLPPWWPYAAAGGAALVLVLAAAVTATALAARSGAGPGFATVVPPAVATNAQPAAADAAPGGAGAASQADARSSAPSLALPAPAPIAPPAASCSASPTVQFQGRGLAATGIAPVAAGDQAGTVNVTVQQSAADAASALGAVQTRIAAVRDALAKAGVPAAAVQVSYYRSYGDTASRQFTAYASLQASVTGADAMAEATKAVLQVPGVTAYSTSSPVAGRPSQEQVQTAVGQAAAEARDMANSTATAAGVRLGDVQSVVAQPPAICYGPTGQERVVQVTVTYAIK